MARVHGKGLLLTSPYSKREERRDGGGVCLGDGARQWPTSFNYVPPFKVSLPSSMQLVSTKFQNMSLWRTFKIQMVTFILSEIRNYVLGDHDKIRVGYYIKTNI